MSKSPRGKPLTEFQQLKKRCGDLGLSPCGGSGISTEYLRNLVQNAEMDEIVTKDPLTFRSQSPRGAQTSNAESYRLTVTDKQGNERLNIVLDNADDTAYIADLIHDGLLGERSYYDDLANSLRRGRPASLAVGIPGHLALVRVVPLKK